MTFNSTSPAFYFSFTVSLFVCVPSSETAKGKLKSCFYCSSKFIPFYLFKIHSDETVLFRELSAKTIFDVS